MLLIVNVLINIASSIVVHFITVNLIKKFRSMFLERNIFGVDVNKTTRDKIPESLGVVCGCVYLIYMFLFIPVSLKDYIRDENFLYKQFVESLSALLSICCMLLLGFADDVLDLRWRHKIWLPTVASLPLLMVYYVTFNSTTVVVPLPFRSSIGSTLNLGALYYVYMGMLAVFCTNAINILAGVNGLEAGQSVVIGIAIAIFNFIELSGENAANHLFSLQFIIPFIAVSTALLRLNWCPAQVFVGDTFCYFSGMTFAVVGILGHFSKTMLLFFIPQVFNFLYSTLQLFRIVPCPRHRMPRLNSSTGNLEMSTVLIPKNELLPGTLVVFKLLHSLHLLHIKDESAESITINNMTLINLVLHWTGPLYEAKLTSRLLQIQVLCSCVAFVIRYPLAYIFYDLSWSITHAK